jgi:hypothetical protein
MTANTDVGIVAAVFASHSWLSGERRAWDLDGGRPADWLRAGLDVSRCYAFGF